MFITSLPVLNFILYSAPDRIDTARKNNYIKDIENAFEDHQHPGRLNSAISTVNKNGTAQAGCKAILVFAARFLGRESVKTGRAREVKIMDKTIMLSNKICYHCEQTDLFTLLVAIFLALALILIHRYAAKTRARRRSGS